MKRKLLSENRARAYQEANEALGRAQELAKALPCTCGVPPRTDGGVAMHADLCAKVRLHRAIYTVYDTGHRAGQCRERERVAAKLRSRSGPLGFGLGYGAAADAIARMRFPR